MSQRILGLDIGEKRIGIAIADPLNSLASGVKVLKRKNMKEDIRFLQGLIKKERVGKVIVGLPLDAGGRPSSYARTVLDFVEKLRHSLTVPIEVWDERLTSQEAEKILLEFDLSRKKRKDIIDKVAAQIILQSYLDYMKVCGN